MSKKCISCGASIEDDAIFCSECGTKQETVEKKCSNCGTVIKEGAKFCMNCGTPVGGNRPAVPVQRSTQEQADYEISQPDENTITITIKGVSFNMKLVKGGMLDDNREISDFYYGETPVTQALWQVVMGSNPSVDNSDINYPVTNLTRKLVEKFFTRLKAITGTSFNLPTSCQFVYALNMGVKEMHNDAIQELKWDDGELHPVKQMMRNRLGIYDMMDYAEMVSDLFPEDENYYHFNPNHESVINEKVRSIKFPPLPEFYASSINTGSHVLCDFYAEEELYSEYESRLQNLCSGAVNKDCGILRIVLDIPVPKNILDQRVEKETLEKKEFEKLMIDKSLKYVKSLNKQEASLIARLDDGEVIIDVEGSVDISELKLKTFDIQFGDISGDFDCSDNELTSLEGAPESVGGDFDCSGNELTSLEGAPESVGDCFNCGHNKLTSLEGCPKKVGGNFACYMNELTSLEGCPKEVGGDFYCNMNNELTSLEGAPESVGGDFDCSHNELTSLEGAPESVGGDFYCEYNNKSFSKDDVSDYCDVKGKIKV